MADNGFHGNHADGQQEIEENIVDQVWFSGISLNKHDYTSLLHTKCALSL